jgi:hypothetical protein
MQSFNKTQTTQLKFGLRSRHRDHIDDAIKRAKQTPPAYGADQLNKGYAVLSSSGRKRL